MHQLRVESIDMTAGDEAAVERAARVDEVTDELTAIENVATLEAALAEIRRQRRLEPHTNETREDTPG